MEDILKEIRRYLKLIHKRRNLFLLTAVIISTAVVVYSYRLPKKYRADSTVFIERSVINNLIKGIAITPDMEDRVRVIHYALTSRDIVGKVLAKVDHAVDRLGATSQDAIRLMQQLTGVSVKDNNLFVVSVVHEDPAFAQEYINTLVSTYVEENVSANREETYGANRFMDEQLVLFKKKLDEAEDAIIQFRKKQGILNAVDEGGLLLEIKGFRREIEELNLKLDTLSALRTSLKTQLAGQDPRVTIFSERNRNDRLNQVQERISQLLLSYTEDYPEVIRLKSELESLKRRKREGGEPVVSDVETTSLNPLYQSLTEKLMETEGEISITQARKSMIERLADERTTELQFVPESRKELGVLIQERDSLRRLYEELLLREGQSEVAKQMEIGDKATTFRIVDPAIRPQVPISPNMVRMILMALAAGLGSAFGLIFLLEQMRNSISDSSQLNGLGVNVIAIIPTIAEVAVDRNQVRQVILVYSLASIYVLGVLGLLVFEALGRTY